MKTLLLILSFTLLSLKAEAKKIYYPLEAIAAMADLIVIGEITDVKSNSYTFKISETIKGSKASSIKVKMFTEWTCDKHLKPVEKGQKLFLFLHKSGTNYEIINGSSGELFVIDNKISGQQADFNTFKTAILNFTQCYAMKGDYDPFGNNKLKQLKSEAEIEKLRVTNAFSIILFDKAKEYEIIS